MSETWIIQFVSMSGHATFAAVFDTEKEAEKVFKDIVDKRSAMKKDDIHCIFAFTDSAKIHRVLNLVQYTVDMGSDKDFAKAQQDLNTRHQELETIFGGNTPGSPRGGYELDS